MREIRFKLWFPVSKTMSDGYTIQELVNTWCGNKTELDQEKVKFVEFTGIIDGFRIPIYEGDIVTDYRWGAGERYTVVWRNDGWHLDAPGGLVYDNGDYYHGYEVHWDCFKVLGNVYQSPELLESQI